MAKYKQYKKKYEEVSKILDFSKSESIKKDDVIEGLNDDLKNKEHELEIQRTKHLEEKINLLYKLVDALQNKTNTNYYNVNQNPPSNGNFSTSSTTTWT